MWAHFHIFTLLESKKVLLYEPDENAGDNFSRASRKQSSLQLNSSYIEKITKTVR